MKKILYSILLALIVILPNSVFAAGYISAAPTSLSIEQGNSASFTITAYNAVGDVSISSSDSSVATISTSFWETGAVGDGQTITGKITVTGVNIGTATITLNIDGATFDGEELSGQVKTINVNVIAKKVEQPTTPPPTPTPTPTPQPTPSTSNNNNNSNNNNSNNSNNNVTNNLSTNNNLKSLTVEGYELVKVDNNNYTLTVSNNITSIILKAEAEDSKAKVDGLGTHQLNVGENNIEIMVTSESGSQNKINVKVTRKDGYYLEDLESILNDKNLNNIDINISSDTKLSKEDITKIKNSKKIINLNYYDENKKLVYSWIIDGSKIKDEKEFLTTINYTSDYIKEISKLANYADGLYFNAKHNKYLPEGTKLKIYLKDKFENNSKVNIYYYKDNKLTLLKEKVLVKDNYIVLEINNEVDYFVTMANINNVNEEKSSSINIFVIISLITVIIVEVLLIIYITKIRPKLKERRK